MGKEAEARGQTNISTILCCVPVCDPRGHLLRAPLTSLIRVPLARRAAPVAVAIQKLAARPPRGARAPSPRDDSGIQIPVPVMHAVTPKVRECT